MSDCPLLKELVRFVKSHELDREKSYLVGVSGGRDSVVLLHLLLKLGFTKLTVCHLNHGLRGKESDRDTEFVQKLCTKLEVTYVLNKVDVSSLDGSMETAARNARHTFFAEEFEKYKAHGVFLAHHADDQAETVLYNLFRGGAGLQGMREVSGIDHELSSLIFLRPLLGNRREEIDQYVKKNGISYVEDSTNSEAVAVRNRMRNELMPLVESIMSRDVVPMINRACYLATQKDDFIDEEILLADYVDPQDRLFLPTFLTTSPLVQQEVMKQFLIASGVSGISFDLIQRAVEMASGGLNNSPAKLNLPEDRFLRRKEKRLFVE